MCLVPYLVPVSDKCLKFRIYRGEYGTRTHYLLIANQTLYQMS